MENEPDKERNRKIEAILISRRVYGRRWSTWEAWKGAKKIYVTAQRLGSFPKERKVLCCEIILRGLQIDVFPGDRIEDILPRLLHEFLSSNQNP